MNLKKTIHQHFRMGSIFIATLAFPLAILSACGGGGSSGGTTAGTSSNPAAGTSGSTPSSGTGSQSGTTSAQVLKLISPTGLTFDQSGNLYVVDAAGDVQEVGSNGTVTAIAGTAGVTGSSNGTGAAAQFNKPSGIAVDASGNKFVVDTGNSIIRKIDPNGVVTTFAGTAGVTGKQDGAGSVATFDNPSSIAINSAGDLFVSDTGNNLIREITPSGQVTTFAGGHAPSNINENVDGVGSQAEFNGPQGIAIDASGNLYVADTGNLTIRKITPTASVTTLVGGVSSTQLSGPLSVAVDSTGNLYILDVYTGAGVIKKLSVAGVLTTFAGTQWVNGNANGTGASVSFFFPSDIAIDSSGNLFVSDTDNHVIKEISPAATSSTFAPATASTSSTSSSGTSSSTSGTSGSSSTSGSGSTSSGASTSTLAPGTAIPANDIIFSATPLNTQSTGELIVSITNLTETPINCIVTGLAYTDGDGNSFNPVMQINNIPGINPALSASQQTDSGSSQETTPYPPITLKGTPAATCTAA